MSQQRPFYDRLIAAMALEHGYTLVTRNEADLQGTGLQFLNPFDDVSGHLPALGKGKFMTQQPEYQPSEALLAATLEMFGNEAAARRWLAKPRATLGGLSPLQFAHTQPDGEQYIINCWAARLTVLTVKVMVMKKWPIPGCTGPGSAW